MTQRPRRSKRKAPKRETRGSAAQAEAGDELAALRGKIDAVDEQIQRLIAERAQYAKEIGVVKGLTQTVEYYRPEREAQVLRMARERNKGPLRT
jgi:chorismate mutase/prephenate dehydratase